MTSADFPPTSAFAVVALGSNLGDSRQIISSAIARLRDFSDSAILTSSLWRTSPVDCPPGSPAFINAVVGFSARATETPESLLRKLQDLEKDFGRRMKKVVNEPRPLDLDLILFGNQIRQSTELILPHPRAHVRKFVLCPLSEVAPDLVLPGQGKTVTQLLAELQSTEQIKRLV